jgi:hypothetical protein
MKKPFILSIFILCLKLSLLTFDTSVNAQALPIVLTIVSRMTDQPLHTSSNLFGTHVFLSVHSELHMVSYANQR